MNIRKVVMSGQVKKMSFLTFCSCQFSFFNISLLCSQTIKLFLHMFPSVLPLHLFFLASILFTIFSIQSYMYNFCSSLCYSHNYTVHTVPSSSLLLSFNYIFGFPVLPFETFLLCSFLTNIP